MLAAIIVSVIVGILIGYRVGRWTALTALGRAERETRMYAIRTRNKL